MSNDEKNINTKPELLDDNELDLVSGGRGFVVEKETVIGGDNEIKSVNS